MELSFELPNGCRVSHNQKGEPFTVVPANWQSEKASLKKDWYIFYRFYDPRVEKGQPFADGKQVFVKRMNKYGDRAARQAATRALLQNEKASLLKGYNPIQKKFEVLASRTPGSIEPYTPFITALRLALERITVEHNTRIDLRSKVKYVEQAALFLGFDQLPIKDIRRKHMKQILERIQAIRKDTFSDYTYNSYLSKLHILFSELLEWEAAETNPISDMKKRKWTPAPKKILTPEECEQIDDFVYKLDKRFHRLIHIFFHSGARTTEIFSLQGEHVDLKKQLFKVFIKKGRSGRWVEKPIQNVVLPFWIQAMENCGPKDYVFSRGLEPGPAPIRPDQAKRRWARHVQGKVPKGEKGSLQKLNIACSWYQLKYLNTERTAAKYGLQMAAAQNNHQSLVITMGYAVGEKQRMQEAQKSNDVKFAG